jgi:hypothetical protein
LRFRVYARFVREQQILVSLHRISFLRVVSHEDLSVEDGARFPIENSLVQLMTSAVRLAMINY